MNERRDPTHILTVEIPLHVTDDGPYDFDPFKDALTTVLAMGRAAFAGYVCGDVLVTMTEPGRGDT